MAAFTVQVKDGRAPELKAFAAQQLPVLQEHLWQVRTPAPRHAAVADLGAPRFDGFVTWWL